MTNGVSTVMCFSRLPVPLTPLPLLALDPATLFLKKAVTLLLPPDLQLPLRLTKMRKKMRLLPFVLPLLLLSRTTTAMPYLGMLMLMLTELLIAMLCTTRLEPHLLLQLMTHMPFCNDTCPKLT